MLVQIEVDDYEVKQIMGKDCKNLKLAARLLMEDLKKRYLNIKCFSRDDINFFTEELALGDLKYNDTAETVITEQCPESPKKEVSVKIMTEFGKLWLQPEGYGDKTSEHHYGWPISLEIWQGRLRLIVFDDISCEDPKIIDLEKAKESLRPDDIDYNAAANYIAGNGRKIFTGHLKGGLWNARCMDAYTISKQQDDKAAYGFLIRYGDEYSQSLTENAKLQWQNIKDGSCQNKCNWCENILPKEPVNWNGLLFCSQLCLDECRVAQ